METKPNHNRTSSKHKRSLIHYRGDRVLIRYSSYGNKGLRKWMKRTEIISYSFGKSYLVKRISRYSVITRSILQSLVNGIYDSKTKLG